MNTRHTNRRIRGLRTGSAVAVSAALLAGLTACAGEDADAGSGGGGESGGAFPAKVATKFGEVTVEKKPKRVVALGWGDAETALALGVQPVGASDWLEFGGDGVGPWAKGEYDKSPQLIGTLEPEYEKIAELQPDVILDTKSSGDRKRYDTLSKIAPTVGVPKGSDQYLTPWEKQTEMIAKALGVKEKGAELVADTEKKFDAAAKKHPEFKDKTITVGSRTSEGYGAYVRGAGRVDFVERLGFKNSPAVEKKAGKDFSITVSRENLDLLDADLTVMAPIGIPPKKISDDPLYRAVPSVKDGRSVVFKDGDMLGKAFATDSVLSVVYALDEVVPVFADALDGDS
ncbi:iron-siderophore ABC transporter substrate-binding protein [Streptomyces sulphureus]|uniref:iron-siderophore ABC transporter substrate-binding protein n=1 Tax=Streptomyces sulphureus TaxID=47758 RepID=UPI00036E04A9|nr:iron-siderophore ABC transporter substrate-binding protein [Streptomyces sulphureus]